VLHGAHDVTQTLLAVADPTLGIAHARPFDTEEQCALDGRDETAGIVLENVIHGPVVQSLDRALLAERAGDEYEGDVRSLARGDMQRRKAIEARNREVGDDDVRREVAQGSSEAPLRVDADRHTLDASCAQLLDGEVGVGRVILDDQYA